MRRLSRREALQRMAQVAAATGLPFSFTAAGADTVAPNTVAAWPELAVPPIAAKGYGSDPNLIHPAPAPWPRTLSADERATLKLLADIIIPAEGDTPSASEVGAVDVLDEWVSAPYPDQQSHRIVMLTGLAWLDTQAQLQTQPAKTFSALTAEQRLAIVERIAYPERATDPLLAMPTEFFSLVRQLVVGAFYTSPEGSADLGYMGNVPIAGEYPGPTPAAEAHLARQLQKLGLTAPKL